MSESENIQNRVYEWALAQDFTAPYGVLTSDRAPAEGRKYRSVVFGHARTRDVEVRIYNRNFIVVRDSAYRESRTFNSEQALMVALNLIAGV